MVLFGCLTDYGLFNMSILGGTVVIGFIPFANDFMCLAIFKNQLVMMVFIYRAGLGSFVGFQP